MHWIRTNRLVTAGLCLAVVGLVLLGVAAGSTPGASFGWFAYAPLASNPTGAAGPTAGEIFGMSLAGVGLILIAGAWGYLRGRRRS